MNTQLSIPTPRVLVQKEEEFVATWCPKMRQSWAESNALFRRGVMAALSGGALFNHVKEEGKRLKIIPHGEFGPWLQKHCPEVTWRTCQRWMELAAGAADVLQIRHVSHLPTAGYLALHDASSKPAAELPPPVQEIKRKLDVLVANKSQKELRLEFRAQSPNGHQQYHPPKPLDAKAKVAEDNAEADRQLRFLTAQLQLARSKWLLCQVAPDVVEALMDECVETSNLIRAGKRTSPVGPPSRQKALKTKG